MAGTGAGAVGDLRAQTLAANASPGADTITFVCGAPPCTITLAGPLPPITDSLGIDGGSLGNVVISGANSYRVFFVDIGTVGLSNLVIQDARAVVGAGGTGLIGHNGTAGTANSTSLFNYAGTVNGSLTTGPLSLLNPVPAGVTAVPTLNDWMLALLVPLVLGIGWKDLRRMGRRSAF